MLVGLTVGTLAFKAVSKGRHGRSGDPHGVLRSRSSNDRGHPAAQFDRRSIYSTDRGLPPCTLRPSQRYGRTQAVPLTRR